MLCIQKNYRIIPIEFNNSALIFGIPEMPTWTLSLDGTYAPHTATPLIN